MYEEKHLRKIADRIEDDDVRDFTHKILDAAPVTFWTKPPSSSGKYHPSDENKEGGTVLHTMRAIEVVYMLSNMEQIPQEELDILLSATIIHDTCSWGFLGSAGHTVSEHDTLVRQLCKVKGIDNKCSREVLAIVECHAGRWGTKPHICGLELGTMLHLADMVASRSNFTINVKTLKE